VLGNYIKTLAINKLIKNKNEIRLLLPLMSSYKCGGDQADFEAEAVKRKRELHEINNCKSFHRAFSLNRLIILQQTVKYGSS